MQIKHLHELPDPFLILDLNVVTVLADLYSFESEFQSKLALNIREFIPYVMVLAEGFAKAFDLLNYTVYLSIRIDHTLFEDYHY